MKWNAQHRQFISVAVILFYFTPLFMLTAYSLGVMSREKSWSILSIGLSLLMLAALILIVLIRNWESNLRNYFQQKHSPSIQLVTPLIPNQTEFKVTNFDSLEKPESSDTDFNELSSYLEAKKQVDFLVQNIKELEEKNVDLLHTLNLKDDFIETISLETSRLQSKEAQITQDFSDYRLFADEQLRQKNLQLSSLQQTIEDQRNEMEKRLEQIQNLDTKVHDLSFEIKTLLYLNESDTPSIFSQPFQEKAKDQQTVLNFGLDASTEKNEIQHFFNQNVISATEAYSLLKHCMEIAEKLSGSHSLNPEVNRYRDLQSSRYAIDQRRLFDSLREETSTLVLVFSLKENKLIFVNSQSKHLLGWTPEKFVIDFPHIIQSSLSDWKIAIQELSNQNEYQTRLLFKTKSGSEIFVNCLLGSVSTGLFRQHAIGVLFKS